MSLLPSAVAGSEGVASTAKSAASGAVAMSALLVPQKLEASFHHTGNATPGLVHSSAHEYGVGNGRRLASACRTDGMLAMPLAAADHQVGKIAWRLLPPTPPPLSNADATARNGQPRLPFVEFSKCVNLSPSRFKSSAFASAFPLSNSKACKA